MGIENLIMFTHIHKEKKLISQRENTVHGLIPHKELVQFYPCNQNLILKKFLVA